VHLFAISNLLEAPSSGPRGCGPSHGTLWGAPCRVRADQPVSRGVQLFIVSPSVCMPRAACDTRVPQEVDSLRHRVATAQVVRGQRVTVNGAARRCDSPINTCLIQTACWDGRRQEEAPFVFTGLARNGRTGGPCLFASRRRPWGFEHSDVVRRRHFLTVCAAHLGQASNRAISDAQNATLCCVGFDYKNPSSVRPIDEPHTPFSV